MRLAGMRGLEVHAGEGSRIVITIEESSIVFSSCRDRE